VWALLADNVSCGHGEVKEGREGMNMYLRSLQGGLCRAVSFCFPFCSVCSCSTRELRPSCCAECIDRN
jgi:hypothetical protein